MAKNRRKQNAVQKIQSIGSGAAGIFSRHWKIFLAVLCVVVIAGSLIEAAGLLSSTRHFTLAVAEVVGAEQIDPDEIAEICGLVPGITNTFAVDVASVRAACLSDDRIAWAEVRKFLPDRVRVSIREARPRVLVATGRDLVSFDAFGRPIYSLPPDWVPGLPILTGLEELMVPVVLAAPAGENRDQRDRRVDAENAENERRMKRVEGIVVRALELYSTMEATDAAWLEGGATISWNAATGFEMMLPDRPRLVFGHDRFMEKAARINLSLSAVALRGIEIESIYLDNELDPGSVLLRRKVGADVDGGDTAITRQVEFE